MTKIAFQGNVGAYSDLACRTAYPAMTPLPCNSFADAFIAVEEGDALLGMIPIDNTIAGRVADIHHLLPQSGLHIIGEHYIPVHHCLLGVKGANVNDINTVYSHVHALPQCRKIIKAMKLEPIVYGDTARSAEKVARMEDKSCAAIASELAFEIYDLQILKRNIEDETHNTTRFIVISKKEKIPEYNEKDVFVTSLVFKVRNIPAVLYKPLGGFATNGLNMTKLESYIIGGSFTAAQFYCDIEGHPDQDSFQLALEELKFYAPEVKVLGTYKAHSFRLEHR